MWVLLFYLDVVHHSLGDWRRKVSKYINMGLRWKFLLLMETTCLIKRLYLRINDLSGCLQLLSRFQGIYGLRN